MVLHFLNSFQKEIANKNVANIRYSDPKFEFVKN